MDRQFASKLPPNRCAAPRHGLWLCAIALLLSACLSQSHATLLEDHQAAVQALRHPHKALQSRVGSFTLPLSVGHLEWEGGRCRVLGLCVQGDSLLAVELVGRGRLHLKLDDSLEALSARAFLGKRWSVRKVRQLTLLTRKLPKALEGLAWEAAKPSLPYLPPPAFFATGRLKELHPDNPLLARWPGPDPLWLSTSPDQLVLRQDSGSWRLGRPLHDGSRIEVVVAQASTPGQDAWLAPTFHPWPAQVDHQQLEVELHGGWLHWKLDLWRKKGDAPVVLLLDPAAELAMAYWTRGQLKSMIPANWKQDGPWLLLEADQGADALHLSGRTPLVRVREQTARCQFSSGADWFPRLPWWEAALPSVVQDPEALLGLPGAQGGQWTGLLDGRAAQRLQPLPADAQILGEAITLCWTPLRDQADRHSAAWTPPPKHTHDIADLSLPRNREVRPPSRDALAEPVDLVQGRDSLSAAILAEDGGALLEAGANWLIEHLGPPQASIRLWESSRRPTRGDELLRLRLGDLVSCEPLQLSSQDLRSGNPTSQLTVLETMGLGWWLPSTAECAAEARWIHLGAARACALRLMEDLLGAEIPARLRQEALEREGSAFKAMAMASLPRLGERAEGSWRNGEVQDQLAWRLALVLENIRWRLRDPQTLQDSLYLHFLTNWRERRLEALAPRRPLDDLASALGAVLVGEELLVDCGFDSMADVRGWLDAQWNTGTLPTVRVEAGQVDDQEGTRLALRVNWDGQAAPASVLPVLLKADNGWQSFNLRCLRQTEQFTLPVAPSRLQALEIAPGASLPAHVVAK